MHSLEHKDTRLLLANPLTAKKYNIFAVDGGLVKKLTKDRRYKEVMGRYYPNKAKNTINVGFDSDEEWGHELIRLRDRCSDFTISHPNINVKFGDGTLSKNELMENLIDLMTELKMKYKTFINLKFEATQMNEQIKTFDFEYDVESIKIDFKARNRAWGKAKTEKKKKEDEVLISYAS